MGREGGRWGELKEVRYLPVRGARGSRSLLGSLCNTPGEPRGMDHFPLWVITYMYFVLMSWRSLIF